MCNLKPKKTPSPVEKTPCGGPKSWVFFASPFGGLQELAEERNELRAAQRQLRHEHVQLLRGKAATQDRLAELQQKALDVQMLKFGQVPQSCLELRVPHVDWACAVAFD